MNWDLSKLYSGFDDPKLIADAGAAFEQVASIRAMIAKLPGDAPAENLAAVVRAMQSAAGLQIKVSEFAYLTLAVDANCEPARAFYSRVIDLNAEWAQLNSALSRYLGGSARCSAAPIRR